MSDAIASKKAHRRNHLQSPARTKLARRGLSHRRLAIEPLEDRRLLSDGAVLVSQTIPNNTQESPGAVFRQTWTMKNSGTTVWSPGANGYTLNLVGTDKLGAVPLSPNFFATWYHPYATIGSGGSISPGGQAAFTMDFIAPNTPGTYSDTFQISNANDASFGPQVTVQIVVAQAGASGQYDRAKAVSYANNYAGYVGSDGYFWTDGSTYSHPGAGTPVPTSPIGDDCAHFVSSAIGSEPNEAGGGLDIPSRVPPTYGEPGAARLANTVLLGSGNAIEVSSLSNLSPGDVIAYDWTNNGSIDHVALYLGNAQIAAHSVSYLDVPVTYYGNAYPNLNAHLIHILDSQDTNPPTVTLTAPAFTNITTPSVPVAVTDNNPLPDGTAVALDVDLNNDEDFTDPGEASYTTSTLSSGSASFNVAPALLEGTYPIRARVSDQVGNEGMSAVARVVVDITPPTVTIAGPSAPITASGSISYTVTYADANFSASTLDKDHVTLNYTGTARGEVSVMETARGTVSVMGTGPTRTIMIGDIRGDGSLWISLAAGTASDLAGNLAPAAGPSSTFLTVDLPGGSGTNSVVVSRKGDGLLVFNNKKQLFNQALGSFQSLIIQGAANKADKVTVDLGADAGSLIPDGIAFDGRPGRQVDTLTLRGTTGADTFEVGKDSVGKGYAMVNGLRVALSDVEQLTLDGGIGNDIYQVLDLSTKTTIVDSKGTDVFDFSGATVGVAVDLSKSCGQTQKVFLPGNTNTLALMGRFENVTGTPKADLIKGNSSANTIRGGDGNDTLYGNSGNDALYGEAGDDWLYGEAGNDSLYGGPGNNVLLGGAGSDLLDASDGVAAGLLAGRNLLIGGAGSDALQGGAGDDILIGGMTSYDSKAAALAVIMTEWTSTNSFEDRSTNLDNGINDSVSGLIRLTKRTNTNRKGTVLDDGVRDFLFGGGSSDWFFKFGKE